MDRWLEEWIDGRLDGKMDGWWTELTKILYLGISENVL